MNNFTVPAVQTAAGTYCLLSGDREDWSCPDRPPKKYSLIEVSKHASKSKSKITATEARSLRVAPEDLGLVGARFQAT